MARETIRELQDSASGAAPAVPLPRAVKDLVTARLERLSESSRRLIATASVIGREFDFVLLQHAAELPDRPAEEAVEELVRRRVFHAVGERLDFAHERIRQVVLDQIVPPQRRILHRLVAAAIEQVYPSSLDAHAAALATHYREGEVWDRAVTYLRRASAQAMARLAYRQAAESLQQALVALAHVPETAETIGAAIDVRLDVRHALSALGQLDAVLSYLREADVLAQTLGDQRRLGWVLAYTSWHLWATGQPIEGRKFAERAEVIAAELRDHPLELLANLDLGGSAVIAGDLRQAEARFRRVAELSPDAGMPAHFGSSPMVVSRGWLAWTCAELGDFDAGIRWGGEGLEMAERIDDTYGLIRVSFHVAYLHAIRGDVDRAGELLERALALCRDHDVTFFIPYVLGVLGYVRLLAGRITEGQQLLNDAVAAAQGMGTVEHSARLIAAVGDAYLLAGQRDVALHFTRHALAFARERGQRGGEASALAVLGEIASTAEPPDVEAASEHYREAIAIANELEMLPLVAFCHLGLGVLYGRADKHENAREHLVAALTMLTEMKMGLWVPKAEAALPR